MHPRLIFRRAHLIVGLTAGAIVALVGLTGSVLAFRSEIDRALNPGLFYGAIAEQPVSLTQVLAAAGESGGKPTMVSLPHAPGEAFVVDRTDGREVFVDAAGELRGTRVADEVLMERLLRFHRTLLAGDVGRTIVGSASLLLLVMILTGLSLRVARRAGRPITLRDQHTWIGLAATVTLTLSATTGALFAFKGVTVPLLHSLTNSPKVEPPRLAPGNESVSADQVVAAAQAAFPDGRVMGVRLPKKAGDAYRVDIKRPGDPHPYGRTWAWVDPSNGVVVASVTPAEGPWAYRIYSVFNYPLHTGEAFGLPGRCVMLLSGLAPAVLLVTGLMLYRRRQPRRPAASPAPELAASRR